ncbi:hypothetical protein Terro_0778 [Terriglobus roseus DSM 18391]|uniref:Carboxypeptidase regulatory-like domain-containing protein n=1 Tax=Terriglobus roseus (strain DSM 18391 / NRRL B-41598 / KBS 63) TaxID=926566 RepID=I3ZCZ2_TERRK|nr:carboxypeptidase-like regulatory domain-containing protein [Terriglobus roseus]AFL87110.1 hypothetical protein Terro_0778 [Terriglobus roseus DSM 18391]
MLLIRRTVAAVLVCFCGRVCCGQSAPGAVAPDAVTSSLPDGPAAASNASLTGVVTDQEGGLLPGAHVEITAGGRTIVQLADGTGAFHAYGLPAGPYTVHAVASGFEAALESGTLEVAEQKELAPLALSATVATSVSVVATSHDIAVAQVAAEEKQRVLGVIPNFYVVYFKNPAPLTAQQKFHMAWRSTLDPVSFLGAGFGAGVQQATGGIDGWGYNRKGYAQRYGANFADGAISTFLGGAILPMLFHQDPRYYWQGTGTKMSRAKHAIASVVVSHGDDGRREFNYSSVLGNFASAGLSNLYYPAANRNGAGLTLRNAALGSAFGAFAAIMQEFVVPKLTPHRPASGPLPDPLHDN